VVRLSARGTEHSERWRRTAAEYRGRDGAAAGPRGAVQRGAQRDGRQAARTRLDSLAGRPPPPTTTSLAFVVWDNPPIIIGHGSYLDQLATQAGARNVFSDVAAPSAQVSLETIVARDPQWIAVLSDSAVPPSFAKRREWRAVRAVRQGHFLLLPGSLFGRPGPRSGEAIQLLRARLAR